MMITRRKIVTAIGACALGATRAGLAQTAQPAVRRIGVLTPIDQPVNYPVLVDALRRLGYEDGKNVQLLLRSAQSDYGRLPALARELIDAKVGRRSKSDLAERSSSCAFFPSSYPRRRNASTSTG